MLKNINNIRRIEKYLTNLGNESFSKFFLLEGAIKKAKELENNMIRSRELYFHNRDLMKYETEFYKKEVIEFYQKEVLYYRWLFGKMDRIAV
jgi:hypothetical protein